MFWVFYNVWNKETVLWDFMVLIETQPFLFLGLEHELDLGLMKIRPKQAFYFVEP